MSDTLRNPTASERFPAGDASSQSPPPGRHFILTRRKEETGVASPPDYVALAKREAERILDEARRSAEAIEADARRNAEAIEQDAYRQGFEQGERAGEEFGRRKVEPIVKSLDRLVQGLASAREQVVREAEGELIGLAMTMATRILHHQIETRPDSVVHVAREALRHTVKGGRLTLRVNPLDLEHLNQSGSLATELARHSENFDIVEDYEILKGGCRLETESGEIDATIENQLRLLWEALEPEIERSRRAAREAPTASESPADPGDAGELPDSDEGTAAAPSPEATDSVEPPAPTS